MEWLQSQGLFDKSTLSNSEKEHSALFKIASGVWHPLAARQNV